MCSKTADCNWETVETEFLKEIDLKPCDGCDSCYLRCDRDIPMTREEFQKIRFYIQCECHEEIREIVSQDKRVDMGDGVYYQLCRFLDMKTHKCSVYPVRPLVCRIMGHVEWMPCPIERISRTAPAEISLKLMKTYALDERNTYEEWESMEITHDR